MSTIPKPPPGAKADGRRLWDATVEKYELEERELALLRQAVGLADVLAELQAAIERDGPLIRDLRGEWRVHPAVIEARQSTLALARLLSAMRLPEDFDADDPALGHRPQRRTGARGVYAMPGAAS